MEKLQGILLGEKRSNMCLKLKWGRKYMYVCVCFHMYKINIFGKGCDKA